MDKRIRAFQVTLKAVTDVGGTDQCYESAPGQSRSHGFFLQVNCVQS